MNREQIQEEIKELREQLDEIEKKASNTSNNIDFSQFVGRSVSGDIAIFGDKMLKSWKDISYGDISLRYDNIGREHYSYTPNYEVVTLNKLQYGDVFIEDHIQNPNLENFKIFIGIDSDGDYGCSYIENSQNLEKPKYDLLPSSEKHIKVKRFLRE